MTERTDRSEFEIDPVGADSLLEFQDSLYIYKAAAEIPTFEQTAEIPNLTLSPVPPTDTVMPSFAAVSSMVRYPRGRAIKIATLSLEDMRGLLPIWAARAKKGAVTLISRSSIIRLQVSPR